MLGNSSKVKRIASPLALASEGRNALHFPERIGFPGEWRFDFGALKLEGGSLKISELVTDCPLPN
jgi:hypothetical protein